MPTQTNIYLIINIKLKHRSFFCFFLVDKERISNIILKIYVTTFFLNLTVDIWTCNRKNTLNNVFVRSYCCLSYWPASYVRFNRLETNFVLFFIFWLRQTCHKWNLWSYLKVTLSQNDYLQLPLINIFLGF